MVVAYTSQYSGAVLVVCLQCIASTLLATFLYLTLYLPFTFLYLGVYLTRTFLATFLYLTLYLPLPYPEPYF